MKAIEHIIKGIKCDNPKCNWQDMDAEFMPEKWLNVPCPECDSNLFTQDAWDQMNLVMAMVQAINNKAHELGIVKEEDERVWLKVLHDDKGMINGAKKIEDKQ